MAAAVQPSTIFNLDIPTVDGRHRRSEESRRRIVAAALELVRAGDFEPSAEAVAELAGVGLRSVFRHFTDMESLRSEITNLVEGQFNALANRPIPGVDLRERLDNLIARRADVFERIMPYRRAGLAHRHRSAVLMNNSAHLNRILRVNLIKILPEEIALNAPLVEALDLALCCETWIRLRMDQGLSPAEARNVMVLLAHSLLPGI